MGETKIVRTDLVRMWWLELGRTGNTCHGRESCLSGKNLNTVNKKGKYQNRGGEKVGV